MKTLVATLLVTMLAFNFYTTASASEIKPSLEQLQQRMADQDDKITNLEERIEQMGTSGEFDNFPISNNTAASAGMVSLLFGAFCALWAQNTGRSAWTWFFLGAIFNILAVLSLLVKNSDDVRESKQAKDK